MFKLVHKLHVWGYPLSGYLGPWPGIRLGFTCQWDASGDSALVLSSAGPVVAPAAGWPGALSEHDCRPVYPLQLKVSLKGLQSVACGCRNLPVDHCTTPLLDMCVSYGYTHPACTDQ
jgi:hypothetical protein